MNEIKDNTKEKKFNLSIFSNKEVWRSNELCEAKLEMKTNLLSNKIFCLLIANIDKEKFPYISVNAKLLDEQNDLLGSLYQRIKYSTDILSRARITKVYFDNKKTTKEKGFSFENIFQILKYKNGIISGRFNDDMGPLLLDLKSRFKVLDLDILLSFDTYYSQRLYEILSASEYKGEIEYNLSTLQDMLGFSENLRTNFSHFRSKILEKAHEAIHRLTDLQYEYFPVKSEGKSRKIVAVKFVFNKNNIDTYYITQDNDYLIKEGSKEFDIWIANKLDLVFSYRNILRKYVKSNKLIDKIAFAASEIGFDLCKFINYCINTYNSSTRSLNSSINAYVTASLQYKLGIKNPPEFKKPILNVPELPLQPVNIEGKKSLEEDLLCLYNDILPNWSKVEKWTVTFSEIMSIFNDKYPESKTIEFWEDYLKTVKNNKFMNSQGFKAKNFPFLFNLKMYDTIINGGLTDRSKTKEEIDKLEQEELEKQKKLKFGKFLDDNKDKKFIDEKGNIWKIRFFDNNNIFNCIAESETERGCLTLDFLKESIEKGLISII